jgi:hypothetical protein
MPTAEDLEAWLDLQAGTLDRVHPSWFSRIPPALVSEARTQSLGRRWLANQLSTHSPMLFGLRGAGAITHLHEAGRSVPSLGDAMESARELGAMAYASVVRTTVRRAHVKSVRAVLGIECYERVLTASLPELPPPEEPLFWGDAVGDAAVEDRILRQGAAELLGYADSVHRAWGESVRLAFDRKTWTNMATTVLPADIADACLRRLAATHAGVMDG